jgi:hypothetical protein
LLPPDALANERDDGCAVHAARNTVRRKELRYCADSVDRRVTFFSLPGVSI